MSVRAALSRDGESSFAPMAADLGVSEEEAERVTERGRGFEHPTLGLVHPAHLPLAALRDSMPDTWTALCAASSFALTRAPRDRFISALMQRMGEFKDSGAIRADDTRVRDEAQRVCDWLSQRDTFTEIEYIHFARQTDYVMLDGERIISQIFPVNRTDALTKWIASESGLEVDIAHTHARRQPKPWARALQPAARFAGRKLMPRAVKRRLHPIWMASGIFSNASKGYSAIDFGPEIEGFIAEYYAADADLHREAQANATAQHTTSAA